MKWISVKDRLPDKNTDVIVFTSNQEVKEASFHITSLYDGSPIDPYFRDDHYPNYDEYEEGQITHWIHISDIPKPESD